MFMKATVYLYSIFHKYVCNKAIILYSIFNKYVTT